MMVTNPQTLDLAMQPYLHTCASTLSTSNGLREGSDLSKSGHLGEFAWHGQGTGFSLNDLG